MKKIEEKESRHQSGIVCNIQKFSVNDGPGIRTVVFLKGCPLHCVWCANPESQCARAQVLWDRRKCAHCLRCIKVCAKHAISFHEDHFHIEPSLCDRCGECIKECSGLALKKEGKSKTVQQVLDVVLQDRPFYEESGGGITLSGGELLAQPEFAIAILKAAHEECLHTACESTGFALKEVFESVMRYVDWIYVDMKHWDPIKHKEGTGVSNDLILSNMKFAIDQGYNVHVRIPVIPDFNDTLEDAVQFSKALKEVGAKEVQLLPFHQFGENKYDMLDQNYAYENRSAFQREDLEEYRKVFLNEGINAFF
ncbi:glycyl-radical enzyme activating protein family [Firmicutes bacterium M10-2]|nr:glycyl-radical enzyme activating protein family [Firmicutes bacterium M10-2]